jgi:sialate O-acetylesterase
MVAPIQPYAIRGVIWYQGETNAPRAQEYRTLFPRMIKDWREKWGEGDFPFLYVQLAGYHADNTENWPNLRDAQLQTLSLPATGMATAVDIGLPTNIHPMDKMDVGKRLALAARHVAYGEDLVYSGPIFKGVKKDANALRVSFDDLGSGLVIGQSPWVGPGAPVLPTDHLVGFEVAGADGKWKPADAKIDGDDVVVSSADVPAPVAVRYDWAAYPEGNLYNKEGLPASPFHGTVE